MTLNGRQVINFLLDRQLLNPSDIVRYGIETEFFERKNISIGVHTREQSLFVKQVKHSDEPGVMNEAAALRYLSSPAMPCEIRNHIPKLRNYFEQDGILVTGFLPGLSLDRFLGHKPRLPGYVGRQLGFMLSALHRQDHHDFQGLGIKVTRPWITDILSPFVDFLSTESSGTIELVRVIQADGALRTVIDEMRSNWRVDSICHNDIRLGNLRCNFASGKGKHGTIYLVDWELCGPNWSLWDVASLFESFLEHWMISASRKVKKQNKVNSVRIFHDFFQAFWNAYRYSGNMDSGLSGNDRLLQVTMISKLIGLRLLQGCLEYSQNYNEPTKESMLLLESARGFCFNPIDSWVNLVGITPFQRKGNFKVLS